ncbi:MAG: exodeoxyribonuclease VII large subunit [Proteobacteria bacterium]|nr:exodeoxyribonuclease VII large subunit [Pseudomonadota bacterium]
MQADFITVSEFIAVAKEQIEQAASAVWVVGEVSNFTCAASGHWYFSLRDGATELDCVMLKRQNSLCEQAPVSGDKVLVFGSASLYAPRGRFQLAARFLRFDGSGQLHRLFIQRKEEWRQRGWFDKAQPLPPLPQSVGIVCSTAGAVLHDVLHVIREFYPLVRVIIYPAPAQGEDAAAKIAAMISTADVRQECDVLLLCRGGGGLKDLWAYNEEAVVAAVVACSIPVISGIGHETDETLADYAADKRCPTPTAAAAAAVPQRQQLQQQIVANCLQLQRQLQTMVDAGGQQLDWTTRLLAPPQRLLEIKTNVLQQQQQTLVQEAQLHLAALQQQQAALRLPQVNLQAATATLHTAAVCLRQAVEVQATTATTTLEKYEHALALLSPQHLLQRGYSIVSNSAGKVVNRVAMVQAGEQLRVQFADGALLVQVNAGDVVKSNKKN